MKPAEWIDPDSINLLELDSIIESYDSTQDPVLTEIFDPIAHDLYAQIEAYGEGINDYGQQMAGHLERTSYAGLEFLISELGFSPKAAMNFYHANLLQDLGKISSKYDPEIWALPHRPSEEERAEKRKHVRRGPQVLEDALKAASAPEEIWAHPHICIVIPAIMLFHHERVDGTGPYARTGKQMGSLIKTACIVDTLDGDMIARTHQTRGRTEAEALGRMQQDPKYDGAFDELLGRYVAFRKSFQYI